MSLPPKMEFTVAIPAEGGFLGRECNAPDCRRYFKVHQDSIKPTMNCPYCGQSFPNDQLWTQDQLEYIRATVDHEVTPTVADEIRKMFRRAFSGPGWTFTPGPPTKRPPAPAPPADRRVDSELRCPDCGVRFQVDGIFGYCPGCRSENLRLYDADLGIIRMEVNASPSPERALRHAYADLVSAFEIFCRKEAARRSVAATNFQNLAAARQAFLATLEVDIFTGISPHDEVALRRVFQKRHVWEHNEGRIDKRYLAEIPEDAHVLGQVASMSLEELECAGQAVLHALERLVQARRQDGA